MKLLTEQKYETEGWIIRGLFGLLLVITFSPLLKIGFVTGDDFEYYLNSDIYRWSDISQLYAQGTGRFHYLLVFWMYNIPYLIDSQVYYYSSLILPLLVALLLFARLMGKYAGASRVGWFTALLYVSAFQIFGAHTPPAAYPFYFAFSAILLMLGLHFLLKYFNRKRYKYLLLSSCSIAFSTLFYEACLLNYLIVFVLIVSQYSWSFLKKRENIKVIFKELFPYLVCALLYIVIYIAYQQCYKTHYAGNVIVKGVSFWEYFRRDCMLSYYAFPMSAFCGYRFYFCEFFEGNTNSFQPILSVFTQASWSSYIKAIIVVVIYGMLFSNLRTQITRRQWAWIGGVAFLFPFLMNIPLAISQKYFTSIPDAYPTSYFSFFSVIVGIVSLYFICIQSIKTEHGSKVMAIIFGIFLFIVSLFSQYSNERITDDMQLSSSRFILLNNMLDKNLLNENDMVYIEPMHHTVSRYTKAVTHQSNMFASYIYKKTGKHLRCYVDYASFYRDCKDLNESVKMMNYSQAAVSGESFMSLAMCSGKMLPSQVEDLRSDSVYVAYLSVNKMFSVSIMSDSATQVKLSGTIMPQNGSHFHYANLYFAGSTRLCDFLLSGETINPSMLMISNQLYGNIGKNLQKRYPPTFEKHYLRYSMRRLKKDAELQERIMQKAKQQGISFEQSLYSDALWLMYYQGN